MPNNRHRIHIQEREILSLVINEQGNIQLEPYGATEVWVEKGPDEFVIVMERQGERWEYPTPSYENMVDMFKLAIDDPMEFRDKINE